MSTRRPQPAEESTRRAGTGEERELRREFRRFARTNHPDRGGDPEVFAAGLAEFRRRLDAVRPGTRPGSADLVFHRRRRGLRVVTGWWDDRRARRARPPRVR